MRPVLNRPAAHRFGTEEDGGVLVEAILWFPLFFSLFLMITDASVLFMNQARIKRIMQEGSREMAIGRLEECADLTAWLVDEIKAIAPSVTATCAENYLDQPTVSIAWVSAASGELDLTGATGFFGGMTVNISMVYHLEAG